MFSASAGSARCVDARSHWKFIEKNAEARRSLSLAGSNGCGDLGAIGLNGGGHPGQIILARPEWGRAILAPCFNTGWRVPHFAGPSGAAEAPRARGRPGGTGRGVFEGLGLKWGTAILAAKSVPILHQFSLS